MTQETPSASAPPPAHISFEQAQAIVTEFCETLPRPVAKDLEDVEILVCETRAHALTRLSQLIEGDPVTDEEFPLDTKGAFIGDPASREESDETEEEEIVELASGFVVLNVENIATEDECRLVLLHEFGHALGLDEEEVAALGLGVEETQPNEQTPVSN